AGRPWARAGAGAGPGGGGREHPRGNRATGAGAMPETGMPLVAAAPPPEGLKPVFARVAAHYGRPPGPAHRLLANHPALYRQWLGTGSGLLMSGNLHARTPELVILRTARNSGCAYALHSPAAAARPAGTGDAALAAVQAPEL